MSIRAIVEVLDNAPAGLTPAERLVLVVIAENIRDGDPKRETWPGFTRELLARRSGLTGKGSLKDALQRLAKRGMEVRIPLGTDKNGRPFFAVPGRQCRYRLPVFEGEATASPSNSEGEVTTSSAEVTTSSAEVTASPKERSQPPQERSEPPPSPHPSTSPQSLSSLSSVPEQRSAPENERETTAPPTTTAQRAVRAAAVVQPDEEQAFIDWITRTYTPRGPGWWHTIAANGSLPELAAAYLAQHAPEPATPATPTLPPWCGHCGGDPLAQRWREDDDGRAYRCPDCNPHSAQAA